MNEVIEVLFKDVFVAHISTVIEFRKSKRNIHNLRTILVTQTFMILSSENSFDAFINHLRADIVNLVILRRIKIWVGFRNDKNWFIGFCLLTFGCETDSVADVGPFLWGVVSIQENNLFQVVIFVFILRWSTVISNFVKISLVSLPENYVNSLMVVNLRMRFAIILCVLSQYFIKVNSQKFNLNITFAINLFHGSSLLETLYLAVLLFLMGVYSLVKVILTCGAQESRQSRFSHSRKTNWH